MPSNWRGSMKTFLNFWFKTYVGHIQKYKPTHYDFEYLEFLEFLFSPSWAQVNISCLHLFWGIGSSGVWTKYWLALTMDKTICSGDEHFLKRTPVKTTLPRKNTAQNTPGLQKNIVKYWMVLTLNKQWTVPKKEHQKYRFVKPEEKDHLRWM